MHQRLLVIVGALVCGAVVIGTFWDVLDPSPNRPPGVGTWLVLAVSAFGFLAFFARGLQLNTRRSVATQRKPQAPPKPSVTGPPLFPREPDSSLAAQVAELLQVPSASRDAQWQTDFHAAMAAAALIPADPAQFKGPDQMSYAAFLLKRDNAPSNGEVLSLATVADVLTERGYGAVLNPRSEQGEEWVFTCGELLSLRLCGQLVPPALVTQSAGGNVAAGHEVLAASPSEAFLPHYTRKLLRTFMREQLGICTPSVFLIADAAAAPAESVAFNVSEAELKEGWTIDGALRYMGWFLPRQYRALSIPLDSSLARHFRPL